MIKSIFNHANYLKKSLDATWLRNNVIANNIANIDTPNFKASTVEFESILKEKMNKSYTRLKVTNDKHISLDNSIDKIQPVIKQDLNSTIRMDGNNVSIENEQANLAKNAIYYNTLIQKLNKEYDRLRLSITEGK